MVTDSPELAALAAAKEVVIETRDGNRTYRTIIWVATGEGELYVRSFLGDSGRWYRRARADPRVALVAGDTRVEFRAVPATDSVSVEVASGGFIDKYNRGSNLDAMVRTEVLHTTLRLEPVD